jgi:hypothetical protein
MRVRECHDDDGTASTRVVEHPTKQYPSNSKTLQRKPMLSSLPP